MKDSVLLQCTQRSAFISVVFCFFCFLSIFSDFPDGYPEIDRSVFFVNKNTPVTLRCSLNSLGNPPVVWYWYCDNKPILRGIKNTNFGSSLTMIAQLSDHNTACHCRAKSESQWGSYDKNSSKALITIRSKS